MGIVIATAYLTNKKESIITTEEKLDEVYSDREHTLYEIHRHIMFLATHEELDKVRDSIKMRRDDLARQVVSSLCIGDNVLIDNRKGRAEKGTIRKINRTRAVVDVENKGGYNVPFSMIRKEQ